MHWLDNNVFVTDARCKQENKKFTVVENRTHTRTTNTRVFLSKPPQHETDNTIMTIDRCCDSVQIDNDDVSRQIASTSCSILPQMAGVAVLAATCCRRNSLVWGG